MQSNGTIVIQNILQKMRLRNKGVNRLTYIQYSKSNPLYTNMKNKKHVFYCVIDFFTTKKTDRMINSVRYYCDKNNINVSKISIVRRPILQTKDFDRYNATIEIIL